MLLEKCFKNKLNRIQSLLCKTKNCWKILTLFQFPKIALYDITGRMYYIIWW